MNKIFLVLLIIAIPVLIYYFIINSQNKWTLVGDSSARGKYRIDGYLSSKDCLEKALELSKEGDYYNCGRNCINDSKSVDGIRCDEYCGPGGCAIISK